MIVFGEQPDVVDAIAEHGEALDAHAPGVAGVDFRVDAAVFENFGMDHAGADDFKPAGVFAEAAALCRRRRCSGCRLQGRARRKGK